MSARGYDDEGSGDKFARKAKESPFMLVGKNNN